MTIVYTEKGVQLHAAIRAAGHWLREENGQWVSSNDEAVQAIIDGFTIEQARAARKVEISAYATALRNRAIGGYSAGEMASWPLKLSEARAYQVDPLASCPLLTMESGARGVPLSALVQRVLENAQVFAGLEAMIAGIEGMHRDAVDALNDFAAVAAYDFSGGWPAF